MTTQGVIKTSKTLMLPMASWLLLEKIRSTKGFKNANETIEYSIHEYAKKLGLENYNR
jgi:hypothetical protein